MGFSTGGPIRLKLFSAEEGSGGTSHPPHQPWPAVSHPPSPARSSSTLAPSPPRTSLLSLPAWSKGMRLEGWLLPSAAQHEHTHVGLPPACLCSLFSPLSHQHLQATPLQSQAGSQQEQCDGLHAVLEEGSKPRAGSPTLCSHPWSDLKAKQLTSIFLPLLLFSLLLNLLNYLLVILLGIRA